MKRPNAAPAAVPPEPGVAEIQAALAALSTSAPAFRHALRHRLMAYLQAESPAVRALAAEGLGRVGDDRAIPLLIAALKDPSLLVQWNAAHALYTLSVHALVPQTVLAFDDGPAFEEWKAGLLNRLVQALAAPAPADRQEAAHILGVINLATPLPALLAALPDPVPAVQVTIRQTVCRLIAADAARFEVARPGLLALLRDPDPDVRVAGVVLLGALGLRATRSWLEPLLHDVAPTVRAAAAQALGRLRDPAAGAALLPALVDDAAAVRQAAAHALGHLGDRYAVPALLHSAEDEDPQVRHAVLGALAGLAAADALPIFLTALAGPDPVARYHAVVGLGRLREPRALKPLAALRRDRRPVAGTTVAAAAAAAIRSIKG
jgi:HEAT repeat protein